MQINDELLDKLQKLGMLEIATEKREEVKAQLSEILGFVDNLASLKTEDIEVKESLKTPLREDVPQDSHIRESVLAHAPRSEDGYFVVPKIIE